jgi:hypothetical protein
MSIDEFKRQLLEIIDEHTLGIETACLKFCNKIAPLMDAARRENFSDADVNAIMEIALNRMAEAQSMLELTEFDSTKH